MSRYAKFIIAVLGAASTAVAQGLVPETVGKWVPVAIAFATALGVYAIPNSPPSGKPADPNISERGQATATIVLITIATVIVVIAVLKVFRLI